MGLVSHIASQDQWDSHFYQWFDMFLPLKYAAEQFSLSQWPSLEQMNVVLHHFPIRIGEHCLEAVPQSTKTELSNFYENYEQRIYRKGQLQTRAANWHDYLNLLVWMTFPRLKRQLNKLQFKQAVLQQEQGLKSRSMIQQKLAHFDECGVIVVSTNVQLFELLKAHRWQELFYDCSDCIGDEIDFFIFGHGLYEKALTPYLGMTGKSILLQVNDDFFQQNIQEKLARIDSSLEKSLVGDNEEYQEQNLHPVPVLGVKGWYAGKQDVAFYQNKSYFREKN